MAGPFPCGRRVFPLVAACGRAATAASRSPLEFNSGSENKPAIWHRQTDPSCRESASYAISDDATSAGTHPADRVHPGAVAAARRVGLDLGDSRPRALTDGDLDADVVVTVCDRAHEELDAPEDWLHWSIPDPVDAGTRKAFDSALVELDERINAVTEGPTDTLSARPA
jgi:protein-tyrosine-phosphatase